MDPAAVLSQVAAWPLAAGLGGLWGDAVTGLAAKGITALHIPAGRIIAGLIFLIASLWMLAYAVGIRAMDFIDALHWGKSLRAPAAPQAAVIRFRPAKLDTGMTPGIRGMVTPAARTRSRKRRKASMSKKNWVTARVAPASTLAFSTSMSWSIDGLSGWRSG